MGGKYWAASGHFVLQGGTLEAGKMVKSKNLSSSESGQSVLQVLLDVPSLEWGSKERQPVMGVMGHPSLIDVRGEQRPLCVCLIPQHK